MGKPQFRFQKFLVCDLLTPLGVSGRNFVRGGICTLKDIQQSLCAIGSSFQSLNTHRRRCFKGCLAKEFSSLADSDSDEGLSPFLFGSNLAEKIKCQTEINSLSRKIVVPPLPKLCLQAKGTNVKGKEEGLSQKKKLFRKKRS